MRDFVSATAPAFDREIQRIDDAVESNILAFRNQGLRELPILRASIFQDGTLRTEAVMGNSACADLR